jgi:Holliday junction resolvasome RuvABC endonuclease subunit
MAWGVLVAVAKRRSLPIVQATPQEVKRAVTGSKTASKVEVQNALELLYPTAPAWPTRKALVEHAADALAVVVACLDAPVIGLARRMAAA